MQENVVELEVEWELWISYRTIDNRGVAMPAAYQSQQLIASADTITSHNPKQKRAYYFVELMQLLLTGEGKSWRGRRSCKKHNEA